MLPAVSALRYVTPLREGGSLPGIVEADDLGTYVVKFRGAGQGLPVLVAEVVVAGIARQIGLRVPDLVTVDLPLPIAKYEADEEVQDLLTASVGVNLGVDFLPGSFGYDVKRHVEPAEGARVLWLDCFVANVDRTWRNPNLLYWHGDMWCIDHGAAIYFHHSWSRGPADPQRFAQAPFDASQHVMLRFAAQTRALDEELAALMTPELLRAVVDDVPEEWLTLEPHLATPDAVRSAYVEQLLARVSGDRPWLPT